MRRRQFEPAGAAATPPVAEQPDRACATEDPEIFYPLNNTQLKAARDVCGRCPHRQPCLAWALETDQGFGVWGGTSPDERAAMARRTE